MINSYHIYMTSWCIGFSHGDEDVYLANIIPNKINKKMSGGTDSPYNTVKIVYKKGERRMELSCQVSIKF